MVHTVGPALPYCNLGIRYRILQKGIFFSTEHVCKHDTSEQHDITEYKTNKQEKSNSFTKK